jgi:hypothetical protein
VNLYFGAAEYPELFSWLSLLVFLFLFHCIRGTKKVFFVFWQGNLQCSPCHHLRLIKLKGHMAVFAGAKNPTGQTVSLKKVFMRKLY